MQNIESRINKLESTLISDDRFLVVFANKGETRELAIQRVMKDKGIKQSASDFFIIYFNIRGK